MQNLSVNKPRNKYRLIAPSAVIVVLVAVLALLFFLRSTDRAFAPDANNPDEISAGYSELLLQQTPSDDALRLKLIDLYLGLARFADAQRHWLLLQQVNPQVKAYYQFNIAAQQALGLGESAKYEDLRERLQSLKYQELTVNQQEHLADLALRLDAAPVAAGIYEYLGKHTEGAQQVEHYERAALWYFAGNQHHQSARLHALLARQSTGQQRLKYQQQVVADYLAGDDPAAAVHYLQALLDENDQQLTFEQLSVGVNAALLATDLSSALQFNDLRLLLEPDNIDAHQAEVDMSLAAGDIQRAWQARHWLLEHQPNNSELLLQMAELGEWNNDFPAALTLWMRALELKYDPKHYEHAWRIALQIFDFDRGLQLLHPIAQERALTDIEIEAVFFAHESRGTPEQAEQWLRSYIEQYPRHRLAWRYLQQNLEFTEQYSAEIALWERMAQHFTLTSKEIMRWAEVHLYNYDVPGAWRVLNQDAKEFMDDAYYWRLKASVAWEMEDDEQLLLALEHMRRNDIKLHRSELDQLIALLSETDPKRALQLAMERWEAEGALTSLVRVVYLALDLKDWATIQRLVDETKAHPKLAHSKPALLARGSLAWYEQDTQLAESIWLQAIALYPQGTVFREQLLWLYLDTNQLDPIKNLLSKWHRLAQGDSRLWLPFAASNQLLNRSKEALVWYQRHLELNPSDWLSQAAFADALEGAQYYDAALRLRHRLLESPVLTAATEENYRTWLYLLVANYGQKTAHNQALAWQDGSPSMLQLWFEQQLGLLGLPEQEQQKSHWLRWAQQKKLIISDFEKMEEALRTMNLAEVQRLLVAQRMPRAQQVAALNVLNFGHRAAAIAVSELGDEQSVNSRDPLRRQALEALKTFPQGAQIGWQQRDFGGVVYSGAKASVAKVLDDRWYARINADQGQLEVKGSKKGALTNEKYVELALNRQLSRGSLDLSINHSDSDVSSRSGISIASNWQVSQKSSLSLGYDWRDRSEASGLMYGLGQENRLWLRGYRQVTGRDSISWGVEKTQYETRDNKKLGSGKGFELQLAHSVFFEHPTWILKAGFDYQTNALNDKNLSGLPSNPVDGVPFTTGSLLSETYKYAYIGTSLQRGVPGFLNRTEPQYTWLIDGVIGRQWPDNKMTYALTAGVGVQVMGDDELAFTFGYQSSPKNQLKSQSGATLGVSYSLRFGR